MQQFLIGNILVRTDYAGVQVLSEGNLQRFCYNGDWDGDIVTLDCSCEDLTPYRANQLKRDNHVYGIYSHQNEMCLIYHWGNLFHGFAVWPGRFAITFDPKMYQQPAIREDWFFSICSFHRQLLIRDGCVLHASYVDHRGEAILFTGPSGIGKSTQADLWVKYTGAEVINGDRVALRNYNGRWTAFGYPCCGTSGICIYRSMPVKAIVVLAQASDNRIEVLTPASKVRTLVSAIEIYPWDSEEVNMALRISQNIASEVPVIKLSCRPDRDAVEVLKTYLEEHYDSF